MERETAALKTIPYVLECILLRHARQRKRTLTMLVAATRRRGRPVQGARLNNLRNSTFVVQKTVINNNAPVEEEEDTDEELPFIVPDGEIDYYSDEELTSEEEADDVVTDTDSD